MNFKSDYFKTVYRKDFVRVRTPDLRSLDFDTFVVRGISGMYAGVKLGLALKKHLLIVRKPNDGTHSDHSVEGTLGKKWLFLDDFIASGRTLYECYEVLQKLQPTSVKKQFEFVGAYLYEKRVFTKNFSLILTDRIHYKLNYEIYDDIITNPHLTKSFKPQTHV